MYVVYLCGKAGVCKVFAARSISPHWRDKGLRPLFYKHQSQNSAVFHLNTFFGDQSQKTERLIIKGTFLIGS